MKPKPRVTIVPSSNGLGNSYAYKGQQFAYTWAWAPMSWEWCLNLCLFLGYPDLNAWKTAHLQGKI